MFFGEVVLLSHTKCREFMAKRDFFVEGCYTAKESEASWIVNPTSFVKYSLTTASSKNAVSVHTVCVYCLFIEQPKIQRSKSECMI